MRIDAHQHFWEFQAERDAWITEDMGVLRRNYFPKDFLPELTANGVERCIAVQADQSEAETEFLLGLAEEHDEIAGVVGWVDLRAPNLVERLEHFRRFAKLRGVRHVVQAEKDDRFLLREDFCNGIAKLAGFGLTYDILIYPKHLPAAIEFVDKFPKQRFVVDHLAKPFIATAAVEPWATHLRILARHPNVYCKVSGMVTEADWRRWKPEQFVPYLDVALDAFGVERLMFGSDWPVCLLAARYEQVVEIVAEYLKEFSDSDKRKIFGENAARFYGLNN